MPIPVVIKKAQLSKCPGIEIFQNGLIYASPGRMIRKILLVEDNADSRELFSLVIRRLGYEVLEADSGPAALEKASSELPDLILMDISLPGMNGIEATAWIKSNPFTCHTPVLMCSAWQNQQTIDKALTSGAAEFLMKPVTPDALRAILARYLGPPKAKAVNPVADVDDGSSRYDLA
jgi:CheY-like chemotaxis protein